MDSLTERLVRKAYSVQGSEFWPLIDQEIVARYSQRYGRTMGVVQCTSYVMEE